MNALVLHYPNNDAKDTKDVSGFLTWVWYAQDKLAT